MNNSDQLTQFWIDWFISDPDAIEYVNEWKQAPDKFKEETNHYRTIMAKSLFYTYALLRAQRGANIRTRETKEVVDQWWRDELIKVDWIELENQVMEINREY